MKVIRNLIGSFSIVTIFIIIINCSGEKKYSEIGNKIISQNRNLLFDSLSIFDIKTKYNVEINKIVDKDSSIFYNYNLTAIDFSFVRKLEIKKFDIKNIKSFQLALPKSFHIDNREYSTKNIEPQGKVIWIDIFNFYIDDKNNEAFLMVRKGIKGGIGYKTDIYYFKKTENEWKYIKKNIISIG
ncbi:hypothetical protein [Chryseobacterium gambrini]|uniref:hypothetical protein n=1 Tax=Chryseobacterium gambrini TaxID=373672 RepID=UPI0022F3A130|nr:hypothetical protein [Chryseobacterium gambrini]WBX98007.1 hypothetical protein PE065_01840 [Chryseobacterium gambrini]